MAVSEEELNARLCELRQSVGEGQGTEYMLTLAIINVALVERLDTLAEAVGRLYTNRP